MESGSGDPRASSRIFVTSWATDRCSRLARFCSFRYSESGRFFTLRVAIIPPKVLHYGGRWLRGQRPSKRSGLSLPFFQICGPVRQDRDRRKLLGQATRQVKPAAVLRDVVAEAASQSDGDNLEVGTIRPLFQ